MSWCFHIFETSSNMINLNMIINFMSCRLSAYQPPIHRWFFWLQKASVMSRFSRMCSPSPSQKCSLIVGGLPCLWVPISRIKFGSRWVKMVPLLQRRSNLWFSMPGDFHARKGSNFVAVPHPKRPSTQCSRLLIWCKRRTYDGFMILIQIGSDFWIHVDPAQRLLHQELEVHVES